MQAGDRVTMRRAHYQYVAQCNLVGFITVMMTPHLLSPVEVDSLPPTAGSFIFHVLCYCVILITHGSFLPLQ